MGSYTTTLRRLMDPSANTAGWSFAKGKYVNGQWIPAHMEKNEVPTGFTLWETGDKAYPLIFDDPTWEGYDPTFRSTLNSMIVDYYWGYEIGSETPAMFKQRINAKMRMIMPYYNLLFKAEYENLKTFDPSHKIDKTKDYKGGMDKTYGKRQQYDHSGSATYGLNQDGSIDNEGYQYNFDTPQNAASINTSSPDHMSSAAAVKNNQGKVYTQNGKYDGLNITDDPTFIADSVTDNDVYKNRQDEEHITEVANRYTQYKEWLEAIRNIDEMIIDELRDCFMLCY